MLINLVKGEKREKGKKTQKSTPVKEQTEPQTK